MRYKIPESVLVVIHTPDLQVLLIERADRPGFWQSVTGSLDAEDEPLMATAAREVAEETGIVADRYQLTDWRHTIDYEIYPQWRHRYAPGVTRNTEHWFGLCVPEPLPVTLAPREHLQFEWLPWQAAAERCFSSSNAEAVRQLAWRMAGAQGAEAGGSPWRGAMKLRVVTYNIHKGVKGFTGKPRIQSVRTGLQSMDADIVFLQEVQDRNDRLIAAELFDPDHTQLNYLATDAYPHSVYGRNAVYDHGHHGNAILSRHPILMSENLDISDHRFEQRGLLHAVADINGVEAHLICVHFGLFARSRVRQASALVERVRSVVPDHAPLVIAGDFNDWNHKLDTRICNTLNAVESAHAKNGRIHTFPSHMPWWQLDRIYVRGFDIERSQALTGREWAERSDHVPLMAELAHRVAIPEA